MSRVPLSANQSGRIALATGPDAWIKRPCYFGLWIRGSIDTGMVEETLTTLRRRHSALRYALALDAFPDTALCHAPAEVRWPLTTVDLRKAPPESRHGMMEAELSKLREPFDLAAESLVRAVLIRSEKSVALLGIAIDHIVFDGGSIAPFLRDFAEVYGSLSEGRPVEIAGSDFAAFAMRERQWLQSDDGRRSLRHWLDRWPAGGPFQPVPVGGSEVHEVPAKTWRCEFSAADMARTCDAVGFAKSVSPFCLLTAGLITAVRRRSRAGWGLVFPFSRRVWPGTRHGIGYYNNRLFLDVPSGKRRTLGETVAETRARISDALHHGMVPFETLLKERNPEMYARKPATPYLFVNIASLPATPDLPGARAEFTWLTPELPQASVHGITVNGVVLPDKSFRVQVTYDPRACDESFLQEIGLVLRRHASHTPQKGSHGLGLRDDAHHRVRHVVRA